MTFNNYDSHSVVIKHFGIPNTTKNQAKLVKITKSMTPKDYIKKPDNKIQFRK